MLTDMRTKNCNRESGGLRRAVTLYRPETGRPYEEYATYEENEEELATIRINVKKSVMKRRE
jgi:hypothetical protein